MMDLSERIEGAVPGGNVGGEGRELKLGLERSEEGRMFTEMQEGYGRSYGGGWMPGVLGICVLRSEDGAR
jgi:hypothetical protein